MNWSHHISHINHCLDSCRKALNEVFYGMTAYELEAELKIVPFYKTWRSGAETKTCLLNLELPTQAKACGYLLSALRSMLSTPFTPEGVQL